VRRATPTGLTVGKKAYTLGTRATGTCELILEDRRVPKANILGELGTGYTVVTSSHPRHSDRHGTAKSDTVVPARSPQDVA
jgi:hypothetical protein